ncbi:molybdopterin cofactor-binding domain-containing protein [Nitratireductor sp. ZSWI3]|uniref:xanthine dehydrogenase family protein molybdopterin-binding subunit n=1 Tax=Nitratireductor sp. ZSWI3 TaxID=2966359 RepID=UPI00214FE953|nr:molybdopterin cofactor-binding domain-containing protein [Nitratireductor sp. ZSWI3]MCR4265041.1 molybdopterin-dependent oxidoreductase [Nitratireductor sp. ZSWI3]
MRRRSFLIGSAVIAGGLAVGYRAWSQSFERNAVDLVAGEGEHLLAGWIRIGTDDTVTVQIPHVDMGQGIYTALAMMAAEELDADWSTVRAERAPGEKAFANRFLARGWVTQGFDVPRFADRITDMVFTEAARFVNLQITGGSTAVRFTGQAGMRVVAAASRQMLVEAAARRWGVAPRQLTVRDGVVTDPSSGQTARFGTLAEEAARLSVPSNPRLKKRSEWRLVGTSPLRFDIPAKTDGTFGYGIDLQLPDMLHAAVRAAPVHGGRLLGVDTEPAKALPGVERVVPLERAVAVVAASWWQASRALDLLEPEFSADGITISTQADLERAQDEALESTEGETVVTLGNASEAFPSADASRRFDATYRVPYLHHAAMEPINATMQFADGVLTFWGGEQDALGTKARLLELSGLAASKVVVHGLPAGGSFGRRIAPSADYLDHLVPIARAMAPRPVKLILSREEEFTHGAYRPALAAQMTAALDADGMPTAWMQRYLNGPTRNEAFHIPYSIPSQEIASIDFATHVQTGTWRSVAHTQHAFWTESFIDELAHASGRDPLDYRRMLLPEGSRARRVLEIAAERAGWGEALPPGSGRGIALAESYGTWVAEVVEVSLGEDSMPRIHRVVAAVDCGGLVHPDTALQQVEGGIIMGLSAALREKITLEDGAVAQTNFPDYPVLRLPETPKIEVHFLESDGPWGGLGEPGVPPAAPALANALFAATGRRIRRLPIIDALSGEGGRA